jgi:hypothetical protein
VPSFEDRGCHVVSVTDPYCRNLGFLDRNSSNTHYLNVFRGRGSKSRDEICVVSWAIVLIISSVSFEMQYSEKEMYIIPIRKRNVYNSNTEINKKERVIFIRNMGTHIHGLHIASLLSTS